MYSRHQTLNKRWIFSRAEILLLDIWIYCASVTASCWTLGSCINLATFLEDNKRRTFYYFVYCFSVLISFLAMILWKQKRKHSLISQYVRDLTPRRIIHKINFLDRLYEEQFLRSICSRQVSQEVVPPQNPHCTFTSIFQNTFAADIVGESHRISFRSTFSRVLPPRQIFKSITTQTNFTDNCSARCSWIHTQRTRLGATEDWQ